MEKIPAFDFPRTKVIEQKKGSQEERDIFAAMASTREHAKQYLATHKIPQMFEGLLSCLMLERPEDPVSYIEKKMSMIKEIGLDKVNWETFVHHLHPYRDPVRRHLIRDGSKFDKEFETEQEQKQDSSSQSSNGRESQNEAYKPEVFNLTETES